MNTQTHTTCHNPACRKPLNRRDAHLRSISLEQVAFCGPGCIETFTQLDKAAREGIPMRRRPIGTTSVR